MSEDLHEGGCLCGNVRYRTRGEPAFGLVCHCKFCQKRTGSAFAVVAYFEDRAVEFLKGEMRSYEHRSDETGRWLRIEFCGACGTPVTHTTELRPGARGISGGTFDDPGWFAIERHIWARSARRWVTVPEDVDLFSQGSTGLQPDRPRKT